MARGTWDDFTSKWGFGDGDALEGRDFRTRDILVRLLNKRPEIKAARIRAIPYDRPGLHNACMIILAQDVHGKTDHALLEEMWSEDKPDVDLPSLNVPLEELIAAAYDKAEAQVLRSKKARVQ